MTEDGRSTGALYDELLKELRALLSLSEEQSRREGDLKPTDFLHSVELCGSIIDRVRKLDDLIITTGAPTDDPRLAEAKDRTRRLVSAIVVNFARSIERLKGYREEILARLQDLTSGVRVAKAYRGTTEMSLSMERRV